MDFMSVKEAAVLWGVSERRVQMFCESHRMEGVLRFGKIMDDPQKHRKFR